MQHRLLITLSSCLLFVSILVPATTLAAQPRDADSNAMIYNGAYTKRELMHKLKNGDGQGGHSANELRRQFSSRGVSIHDISSGQVKNGVVSKNGQVKVDGRVVATRAQSYGRQYMPGSTKDGSLYHRPPAVSFQQNELDAFVYMKNGRFDFAIIKSCGNLVKAVPVAPPPKPQPKPKPRPAVKPVPQPAPSPQPAPAPPAPVPAPELPQAGMGIGGMMGLTALTFTGWRYRKSRRSLKSTSRFKV